MVLHLYFCCNVHTHVYIFTSTSIFLQSLVYQCCTNTSTSTSTNTTTSYIYICTSIFTSLVQYIHNFTSTSISTSISTDSDVPIFYYFLFRPNVLIYISSDTSTSVYFTSTFNYLHSPLCLYIQSHVSRFVNHHLNSFICLFFLASCTNINVYILSLLSLSISLTYM